MGLPTEEEVVTAPFSCTCKNQGCKRYNVSYIVDLPTNFPSSVVCGPCGNVITPVPVQVSGGDTKPVDDGAVSEIPVPVDGGVVDTKPVDDGAVVANPDEPVLTTEEPEIKPTPPVAG